VTGCAARLIIKLKHAQTLNASGHTETASGPAFGHLCDLRSPPFLFRLPAQWKIGISLPQKAPNPSSQARQKGERNPNPSLPLKLHRLRKSANTTKCTPPCACVLAFHKHFSRRYVSSLLDPNAYAQDIDLVALDSRANRDCPS
jgi:hypothetical protein